MREHKGRGERVLQSALAVQRPGRYALEAAIDALHQDPAVCRSATERRCSWGRSSASVERVTIQRMEHVGVVVDDLAAATEFFVELGLKLQGDGSAEGGWVDQAVGLDGVRVEVAVLGTPDGHGRSS